MKSNLQLVYYQVFPTCKWVLTRITHNQTFKVDKKLWALFETKEDVLYFLDKTGLFACEK